MDLVPIILSTLAKPENMQEGLKLTTKGASRISNPNIFEPRPQGKTLEGKAPSKVGNLRFCNGTLNGVKMFSPLGK